MPRTLIPLKLRARWPAAWECLTARSLMIARNVTWAPRQRTRAPACCPLDSCCSFYLNRVCMIRCGHVLLRRALFWDATPRCCRNCRRSRNLRARYRQEVAATVDANHQRPRAVSTISIHCSPRHGAAFVLGIGVVGLDGENSEADRSADRGAVLRRPPRSATTSQTTPGRRTRSTRSPLRAGLADALIEIREDRDRPTEPCGYAWA